MKTDIIWEDTRCYIGRKPGLKLGQFSSFRFINSSQLKIKTDRLEEVERFPKNLMRERGNWQISPNNKKRTGKPEKHKTVL